MAVQTLCIGLVKFKRKAFGHNLLISSSIGKIKDIFLAEWIKPAGPPFSA